MSQLWGLSGRISVLAPVSTVTEAVAAVAAGASLVEVGDGDLISAIKAAATDIDIHIGISGHGVGADLIHDDDPAAPAALGDRADVSLICPDPDAAARAVQRGIAPERILVMSAPAGIPAAVQAGWAVLADADQGDATPAEAEAVAAVCTWLGASVIRTRHVTGVRRSVDMTESILGRRPPARTLRGLA
jgi:hypothetical protein